jgi:hypothetical protein
VDRWHTISGFVVRSPETLHQDSRYCEVRNADGVKDVEKSNSRVYRSFGISGFGSRGTSCSTSRVPKSR